MSQSKMDFEWDYMTQKIHEQWNHHIDHRLMTNCKLVWKDAVTFLHTKYFAQWGISQDFLCWVIIFLRLANYILVEGVLKD